LSNKLVFCSIHGILVVETDLWVLRLCTLIKGLGGI